MSIGIYAAMHFGLAGLIALGVFLGKGSLYPPESLGLMLFGVALAAVAGFVAYSITYSGIRRSVKLFVSYLIGGMLVKLMIGIFSVTIVALRFKERAMEYVLTYFGAYFLLLGLEVFALMRATRLQEAKEKAEKEAAAAREAAENPA